MTSQSADSREWNEWANSSTDASNDGASSTIDWFGAVNDYVFGKLFFELHMVRAAFVGDSITSVPEYPIEAKATLTAAGFPYMECLQSMEEATATSASDARIARSTQDSRFSLMCLIGKVVRRRKEDAEILISSTLNKHMSGMESATNSSRGSSPSRADTPTFFEDDEPEDDLSEYTMRWKEYLDGLQLKMDIKETNIHRNPPLWKATIVYGKYRFEGFGTRKQLAKHRATRKACEALNIP